MQNRIIGFDAIDECISLITMIIKLTFPIYVQEPLLKKKNNYINYAKIKKI